MRLCRLDNDLKWAVFDGANPAESDSGPPISLLRGYPSLKVRLCRALLRLVAAAWFVPPVLASPALRLCKHEIAEVLLGCDPDVVDTIGIRWGDHLQRMLRDWYPQWTTVSDHRGETHRNAPHWRKFDPSVKVSIVLPTHNGIKYLKQAITTTLQQTYHNIELIVIDDGSTEDIAGFLSEFQDDRLRLIRHSTNRGVAEALNTGFQAAQGDYLTWTSDDNYYAPNAVEEMVRFLQTYPELDFVYAEMNIIDERARPEPRKFWGIRPPDWLWTRDSNAVGACFLYRRRVYEKVGGYDSQAFLVEDFDYWLRISKQCRMQRLFKPLYFYRYHDDTLTAKHDRHEVLSRLRRIKRLHGVRV